MAKMSEQLQSFKYSKALLCLFCLFLLAFSQACTSKIERCGDIFSKYAEKPEKLQFIECSKGESQAVYSAKYIASSENANEIEKFLVKKYKLIKFSDYYHSMPMNEVYHKSKSLIKLNPNYSLLINIEHPNFDSKSHSKGETLRKSSSFTVHVSIVDI